MSFFDKIKDVEIWKLSIMLILLFIIIVWSGYTFTTKWGSLYKVNPESIAEKKMTKIKTQTNYSNDMKMAILSDLSQLYEERLYQYCKDTNVQIVPAKIQSDVKYYKLIVIAMNDACENLTIDRFIHNNDLYRYTQKTDWDNFKKNTVDLYLREGKQILTTYYDNSKVIMPIQDWLKIEGIDLIQILTKNTDKLLEDLKTESVIYKNTLENK